MTSAIRFRTATAGDIGPTWQVFTSAADDLARRHGWPRVSRPADPPQRFVDFRRSALAHDPDGFWVAEVKGDVVAFGIAVQREAVWYLAALHVRPAFQAMGVGGEIIRRTLDTMQPDGLLTVGADARNPVSTALYGRFGMFPQVPLLELSGPVRESAGTGAGTDDASASAHLILEPGQPSAADLDRLDWTLLDAARPVDHAFWATTPAVHAYTVRRGPAGDVIGYAYLQADGSIGPLAVDDPADLAPALLLALDAAAGLGATTARVRIPGVARPAIAALLDRGWRYGDGVTLVLTSAPWGRWEGYVTSGADALL